MTDRRDANRLTPVGQLIENPVGADSQRVEATELAAKRVAGEGIALEKAKRILDRVDERPIESEQVPTGSASENQSRQRSACGRPTFCQLFAQLGERDGLAALNLRKPSLQC